MKRIIILFLMLSLIATSTARADKNSQKMIEGFTVNGVCEVQNIEMGEFSYKDEKNSKFTVTFHFANLSTANSYFHELVSSVSLSFMGKYDFAATIVSVKQPIPPLEDKFRWESVNDGNDYLLDPLCEAEYKAEFVVPNVVSSPDKELMLVLTVKGENCEITLR